MKKMVREVLYICLILFGSVVTNAQERTRIIYKQVDSIVLHMDIIFPDGFSDNHEFPAIVFFHGGSWKHGSPAQFENQAKYFAGRGMVCFLPEYRVFETHGTTPVEALMDAKSAIRYIRSHAEEFHINPEKIVGSGGSAGGHLALASAGIEKFNEANDDLIVSCKPDALVLFNPVVDTSPEALHISDNKYRDMWMEISPMRNVRPGAPPAILFFGTKDKFVPVETASKFKAVMEKVGSRCDLLFYEGQPHGFFNFKNPAYYRKTVLEADKFLISIGYLTGEPSMVIDQ